MASPSVPYDILGTSVESLAPHAHGLTLRAVRSHPLHIRSPNLQVMTTVQAQVASVLQNLVHAPIRHFTTTAY
jgi:hypothetical protein